MKKINLIFPVLFITAFISIKAKNNMPDSLTVVRAIRITLKNQPLIKQAEDYVKIAATKIKEQQSFNYPQANVNLSYNFMGPIPTIKLPFGNEIKFFPENNYNANINIGYMLFDFNRRNTVIELLKSNKLTEKEKVNLIKNQLAYRTVQTFYTILFLEKSLEVQQNQINVLKKHIEIAKKRVQSGSSIDLDVLTTKVRVAAAENGKIQTQNNLQKEKVFLRTLTGLKKNTPLNLSGKFLILFSHIKIDSLINSAYNNREELKVAKLYGKTAHIQKEVSELNDVPTVKLFGSYGLKNGYMPNLNALHGNWILGVTASLPIFNGFMKDAKVESAEADIKAVDDNIESLRQKIKAEIEQSALDLKASKQKMKNTLVEIKQAKKALQRAQLLYKNGVITNLTLLDAETYLTAAKLLYASALYKVTINGYKLKEAIGEKIW